MKQLSIQPTRRPQRRPTHAPHPRFNGVVGSMGRKVPTNFPLERALVLKVPRVGSRICHQIGQFFAQQLPSAIMNACAIDERGNFRTVRGKLVPRLAPVPQPQGIESPRLEAGAYGEQNGLTHRIKNSDGQSRMRGRSRQERVLPWNPIVPEQRFARNQAKMQMQMDQASAALVKSKKARNCGVVAASDRGKSLETLLLQPGSGPMLVALVDQEIDIALSRQSRTEPTAALPIATRDAAKAKFVEGRKQDGCNPLLAGCNRLVVGRSGNDKHALDGFVRSHIRRPLQYLVAAAGNASNGLRSLSGASVVVPIFHEELSEIAGAISGVLLQIDLCKDDGRRAAGLLIETDGFGELADRVLRHISSCASPFHDEQDFVCQGCKESGLREADNRQPINDDVVVAVAHLADEVLNLSARKRRQRIGSMAPHR